MLQPKLLFFILALALSALQLDAQSVAQKLAQAFSGFEKDSQLRAGIVAITVLDETGKLVFEKAGTTGLAPASTQKTITTITAYELLGRDFRYTTKFGLLPASGGSVALYIAGSGDPTLGSWRWPATRSEEILKTMQQKLAAYRLSDTVYINRAGWDAEVIPGGWSWEDIGNYYGAGADVINWHENQYDLLLQSGSSIGDPVAIKGTEPQLFQKSIRTRATAAAAGSGDNAYLYFSPVGDSLTLRGTIPVNEKNFSISGAMPDATYQLAAALLHKKSGDSAPVLVAADTTAKNITWVYTHTSPPFDSLIYWFDQKSINLYGEALLKTMAFLKTGLGETRSGVDVVQAFWKAHGLSPVEINVVDGSGLSPLNRVTTHAQASVLYYAKSQPWFAGFYNALPAYNGMKLKSGTIHGVKGFCGYHTSRSGAHYTVSFLVNNYNGPSATLVQKMYTVLDVLK